MNKPNSFHDFAACATYLITNGYVHKNQLAAIGGSAGGLLVGATINKYPDLFCAAILKVSFWVFFMVNIMAGRLALFLFIERFILCLFSDI